MSVNKARPRFHPRFKYKYPEQVILISNSDLHFAVSPEGLIQSSSVFADAFRLPQPQAQSREVIQPNDNMEIAIQDGIHIDTSDVTLEWFINALNSTLLVCPLTDLDETISLIELYEKYEVNSEIIKILKDRVENLIDKSPWKWLSLASRLNDRQMGTLAFLKMGQDGFLNGDTVNVDGGSVTFWNRMSTLSPDWVVPILTLAFSSPIDAKFDNSTIGEFTDRSGLTKETKQGVYGSTSLKVRLTWNWNERCEKFGRNEI